jgi:hypothetical protein
LGLSDSQVQNLMNQLQNQEARTRQYYSANPQKDAQKQNDGMDFLPNEQKAFLRQFFGKPDQSSNAVGEDW